MNIKYWEQFKKNLPHQQEPFSKRNWGSTLHSVCSYQAKMKPALAYHLVMSFSKPGDVVVDPFSGSGTIPFEACLNSRKGLGLDISLLSSAVSDAKLLKANPALTEQLILRLEKAILNEDASGEERLQAAEIKFNGPLSEFFEPDTFTEILIARRFLLAERQDTPEWHLVMACMLHILHGNRPYALSRRSHPITPYAPTGEFEYKSVVEKLRQKVGKSLAVVLPQTFVEGKCFQGDICQPWPEQLTEIDSIITSPPFFDSTRFYMTNWMRFWFCGWSRSDFDAESVRFVEVTQKKSLSVYTGIFKQFAERLKPNGLAVLHLGLSHKCDMAKELSLLAGDRFLVLDNYTEQVGHCESHGIRDKGTVTGHQYLVLQKK